MDPEKAYVSDILSRIHCIHILDHYVKDLGLLHGRELSDIVVVDDSMASFAFHPENGIYIPAYDGNPADNELEKVLDFLTAIAHVPDVRPYVAKFTGILDHLGPS